MPCIQQHTAAFGWLLGKDEGTGNQALLRQLNMYLICFIFIIVIDFLFIFDHSSYLKY
jgi:hypothetical protein